MVSQQKQRSARSRGQHRIPITRIQKSSASPRRQQNHCSTVPPFTTHCSRPALSYLTALAKRLGQRILGSSPTIQTPESTSSQEPHSTRP